MTDAPLTTEKHTRLKYQPALRIPREAGESPADFVQRILRDPRLLPDQRRTLEHDSKNPTPFDDLVVAFWLEQPPLEVRS